MSLTRRSFVAGAAAIPFALWLEKYADAATISRIRYDARSAAGKAMLKTYADAVGKMQTAIAEGDPRSWVFQWYTHWVKGSTTKPAEIARIYPSPSPWRNLAQDMWETCQAHGPGEDEDFFLPWHRMFVYFFESIVRSVSGNKAFTLPYWNYSTPVPAVHGVLPPQFQQGGSAPLFVSKRNPGVNTGTPIDQNDPGALALDSLGECIYQSQGADPGFCQALDSGLHGNVHVLVGNSQNMGAVPWAAGDPIFWMHHSNIDRLWASWNAGGRLNPTTSQWLSQTFVFADDKGNRVVAKVADFVSIRKLGYRYQRLEPVPPCPLPVQSIVTAAASLKRHAAVATPVPLGPGPVQGTLEAAPAAAAAAAPLTDTVRSLKKAHHLYLVIKGLRAEAHPGVLYHVYLDLPAGAAPDKAHYIGALNFFDAVGHGGHAGAQPAAAGAKEKFYSFDCTPLLKALLAKKQLSAKPTVTIAPSGQPAADAKAVCGEVSLVEQ